MDQTLTRHESLSGLEAYSRLSANPVGRLCVWSQAIAMKSARCFQTRYARRCSWQTSGRMWWRDYDRGRRYLPGCEMERFGVTDAMIAERRSTPEFVALMRYLVEYSGAMLADGGRIVATVDADLATTLRLFEQAAARRSTALCGRDTTC